MINFKKPPTESDVLAWLRSGQLKLPPLRFECIAETPRAVADWDLAIEAIWQDGQARFLVECKAVSTPKVFEAAIRRVQDTPLPSDYLPLLVLPYLRESLLAELEQRQISGVDLCGNGVVIVPGRFSVYRTGEKNQFPSYAPIKNVYRKNTSMVGRALLAKPNYGEVKELREEVNTRNVLVARWGKTAMSLGTVSKALKGLEDDLIVDRGEGVRLLQAEKLLEKLNLSYELPQVTRIVSVKVNCGQQELPRLLREKSELAMAPVVATGFSSVSWYAVMQRSDILSAYCPRATALLEQLNGDENDRFPNVELLETEEQPVYFDAREEEGFLWASPVQTYLELMTGDKRDQETADQVRSYLLNQLAGESR